MKTMVLLASVMAMLVGTAVADEMVIRLDALKEGDITTVRTIAPEGEYRTTPVYTISWGTCTNFQVEVADSINRISDGGDTRLLSVAHKGSEVWLETLGAWDGVKEVHCLIRLIPVGSRCYMLFGGCKPADWDQYKAQMRASMEAFRVLPVGTAWERLRGIWYRTEPTTVTTNTVAQ